VNEWLNAAATLGRHVLEFGPGLLWWGWLAYLVVLASWIVLQKREPIATLSWLLSLALLPWIGLVFYHFLGPRRIRRTRLKRLRVRERLDGSHGAGHRPHAASALMRLGATASGYAPTTAREVRLMVDGAETFDAIIAAVAAAQRHVHLEYYIFEPDMTGTRLREALIERARNGVAVRVLLDALGSSRLGYAYVAEMRAAGVEVVFFHRTRWRLRGWLQPRWNHRNHRKIAVIDGVVGFTGGVNITDEENERLRDDAYHDLHLRVEGELVRWLQLTFAEDWTYACGRPPTGEGLWPPAEPGPIAAIALPAGPDSPWEVIHRVMVAAIHQARERVWLCTPYFVPSEAARQALTSAAMRGVDVRVLVPVVSDSRWVSAAARSYYDELHGAGARVFEYPGMLHSKALLVDGDVAVFGSSNFDNRSFRLNFELCVLFEDVDVAAALAAEFRHDLLLAREVEWPRRLGWLDRLGEAWARLLSPLL
jgi:cardiolipin synthase